MSSLKPYTFNRYNDVVIDCSKMRTQDPEIFLSQIKEIEEQWRERVKNAIPDNKLLRSACIAWIKLPIHSCTLMNFLISIGYIVHHAKPDYIMLTKTDMRTNIPNYNTHLIRVECIVQQQGTGRILMVKERISSSNCYKLITGGMNPGETIEECAIREVKEETGVIPYFKGVVGILHRRRIRFDADEMVIACLMHATPEQHPRNTLSHEVVDAKWVEQKEVLLQGNTTSNKWMAHIQDRLLTKMRMDDYRGPPHLMDMYYYGDVEADHSSVFL